MHQPTPVATADTQPTHEGRVLTIAHRGASADAPENTLAAVRRAVTVGADMVEVDVQRTRDGALVVLHDTTLERTSDVRRALPGRAPWRLADLTLDEVRRLDAGCWKSPVFAGERVPTLDEVIAELAGTGVGLLLELKAPHLYPGIVPELAATVLAAGRSATPPGPVVVQSFDIPAMKELKTQVPSVPVGLLGAPARANLPALATWADQVNPRHLPLDQAYVDQVHALGMGCHVWTVNHTPAFRRALRLGVDGIITNRPRLLGRVLDRHDAPAAPAPTAPAPTR